VLFREHGKKEKVKEEKAARPERAKTFPPAWE
jgi:hypothetical protein